MIQNQKKDHLRAHSGLELVVPSVAPLTGDLLRFWTGHPTENTLVDLHAYAEGAPDPVGGGSWAGAFSGRPELIAELAPAIQARLTLKTAQTCTSYLGALRKCWRVCDQVEAQVSRDGHALFRLTSVRHLTPLHEAAMYRAGFDRSQFGNVLNVLNDTRRMMRLGPLLWTSPRNGEPDRQLIPDVDAKALKIEIKRDWERVRKAWERHDAIRRGEQPDTLTELEKQNPSTVIEYQEQNQILRRNWLHLERVQQLSGKRHPTTNQLLDGKTKEFQRWRDLTVTQMRAIAFPTMMEAHIAFHCALMRSGWNPSTLVTGIDATLPNSIFQHPKDDKQRVLVVETEGDVNEDGTGDEELNMQGSKRRAGGRLQFCMGLKKDPDSPPNIVAAYLDRTKELRAQLHRDVRDAQAKYQSLVAQKAPTAALEQQFKMLQYLQQGTRNVWLYVSHQGQINWFDGVTTKAFYSPDATNAQGKFSYLELVIGRFNVQREKRGERPVANVTPSDFRDIYARWVYLHTGGNILSVMLALGHSNLKSADAYVTNNVFNAENDEAVRSFMTHLFRELEVGRVDLTILAQLTRHGSMNEEMHERLSEYRSLTRSIINAGCANPMHPPHAIDPDHETGKLCGTQRCLRNCPHARFLPESVDGIAKRVEELMVILDNLPLDVWLKGNFDKELEAGEYLLENLYAHDQVSEARADWRRKILSGVHPVPGVGFLRLENP